MKQRCANSLVAMMIFCASSIALSALPGRAAAQTPPIQVRAQPVRFVIPDSIVMIRDARDTSVVGYVFPRLVAIEYLNLRTKILPIKNDLIDQLQKSLTDRDGSIAARDTIIRNRDQEVVVLKTAVAKSDSVGIERERQWKSALKENARLKRVMKVGIPAGLLGGILLGIKVH